MIAGGAGGFSAFFVEYFGLARAGKSTGIDLLVDYLADISRRTAVDIAGEELVTQMENAAICPPEFKRDVMPSIESGFYYRLAAGENAPLTTVVVCHDLYPESFLGITRTGEPFIDSLGMIYDESAVALRVLELTQKAQGPMLFLMENYFFNRYAFNAALSAYLRKRSDQPFSEFKAGQLARRQNGVKKAIKVIDDAFHLRIPVQCSLDRITNPREIITQDPEFLSLWLEQCIELEEEYSQAVDVDAMLEPDEVNRAIVNRLRNLGIITDNTVYELFRIRAKQDAFSA